MTQQDGAIDHLDNNLLLQQAEDALLDGNFSRALQISHDLLLTTSKNGGMHLPPRRDEPPLLPLSPNGRNSSRALQQYHHLLPYTSVAFISLHNVDGEFSRCGAVLLQSWYELCRRCHETTTSSSSISPSLPYYYLNCLLEQDRPSVLPIDLLVVWMTLHQALLSTSSSSSPAADEEDRCGSSQTSSSATDGNTQMALKVLAGLLLWRKTAETTAHGVLLDEDRRKYRDYGRELIVLVFLEWLPTLPARRIDELRVELLGAVGASGNIDDIRPNDDFLAADDDDDRASSSLLASRKFCLDLLSAAMGHEWAHETLQSCIAPLHARWIELQHRRTNEKKKARAVRNGTLDTTPRPTSSLLSHHHRQRESSFLSTMTIKDRLLSFPITCCLRMLLWQRQHMHGTTTTTTITTKKWFQYVVAAAFLLWGLSRVRSLCRHGVALLLLSLSINNNQDGDNNNSNKSRSLSLVASVLLDALGLGRYYQHHQHTTAPGFFPLNT